MKEQTDPEAASAAAATPNGADVHAAVACAARAARRFLMTPAAFKASVSSVTPHVETYQRALHVVERRTVHALLAPGHGARRDDVRPLPNPLAMDPWSVDPARIAEDSRVVAICSTCAGTTTVACGPCGGTTRARCGTCGGGGKVRGQRGPKNCGSCRGKGDVKCTACRGGQIECATCAGSGRVFAWLAIEQQTSVQVRSHPDCAARSVHFDVGTPMDFDAGPARWPNQLVEDSGVVAPSTRIDRELRPELDRVRDRVVSVRTQAFSSTVYRVGYATAFSRGEVEVAGQPPAVAASSNWRALSRRRALIVVVGVGSVFFALRARSGYAERHPWFAQYGHASLVMWTALLAAALVVIALAGLTLVRRARSRSRGAIPAGLAGAALAATCVVFAAGGPTRAGAERALAGGDLNAARTEAVALIALAIDRSGGEQIEDTVHMAAVQQSASPGDMAIEIAKPWHDEARRSAALVLMHSAAEETGARLYSQGQTQDLDALAGALDELDPPLAQRFHGLVLLLRALDMTARGDLVNAEDALTHTASPPVPPEDLARAREVLVDAIARRFREMVVTGSATSGDARARRDALAGALTLSAKYAKLAGKPTEPAQEALKARLDLAKREVEAEEKRAAILAAQEEAKRKREEAVAEAKRTQEEAQRRAQAAAADDSSDPGGGDYGGHTSNGGGSVQVRGYTRKNGTYVAPHTRSPRRR
jgi:hypothetical protein